MLYLRVFNGRRFRVRLKSIALLGLVLLLAPVATAQTVVFVDSRNTAGIQNGTSWNTAFTTIQDGIEAARTAFGGEVWVAGGEYNEARPNAGALRLRSGVNLYGGFAGDESVRSQRDPETNVTIIEAGQASGGAPAAVAVFGANDTIIDGFRITHAIGQDGAGMTNIAVSPTVVNCVFTENVAQRFGGAVINVDGATPRFERCIFAKNYAGNAGGAMANTGAAASVVDCEFLENSVGNVGGAIFNVEGGDVFLTSTIFDGNTALEGGGAIFNEGADPAITACSFFRNSTPKFGGAVFNNNGASPLVINSVFAWNTADDRGGAVTTLNSVFTGINCTFAYNSSGNDGGVLFDNASSSTIFNSIMWYNSDAPFFSLDGTTDIRFSNVGGGQDGFGNVALEPQFNDPEADDFSLKATSPSIDRGTLDGAPETDLLGIARPTGNGVDQGAYESEVVLPAPDDFACPIVLRTGPPAGPSPGNMIVVATMLMALIAARFAPSRAACLRHLGGDSAN